LVIWSLNQENDVTTMT